MLVFSGRAPMCRGTLSAHGRISTVLSAGEFPRDSADPSSAGPGRMCSTAPARPMPHIRTRRPRPDTADPHPPRTRPPAPSHRSRPIPGSLRRERLGDPGRARRSIRWAAAGFTSTSLNPRARTSSRRARGLSDVLADYPAISRVGRHPDAEIPAGIATALRDAPGKRSAAESEKARQGSGAAEGSESVRWRGWTGAGAMRARPGGCAPPGAPAREAD